jgi:hypothetical protein
LIERDVMNAPELKKWAKESAGRLNDPQAATWYASQLFKFLINRYEAGARPTTLGDFGDEAPDWVIAKAKAGEPVITIEPQQELRQQAEQVIDWLNAQTAENESPNLRMTWEDAVEAQAEWHADIARQSRVTELTADQMLGVVTIMEFEDGFRWVDVQTEVCLQHEGTVMGHCVGQGGYTQGVSEGTTKILSLRDGNNNPHATIEGNSDTPININAAMLNSGQADLFLDNALEQSFVDMAISQIKGKENKAVVRKYRDYVQDFLTKFQITEYGYGGLNDLENCGLFKLKQGGYTNVEDVGEQVAQMDDGSAWNRVDNEYVELRDYSSELDAKWYLYDKTGRAVGSMTEKLRGVISGIDINNGYNMTTTEKEVYKDHINTAFNTKYDKGRSKIGPDSNLYGGFYNTLEGFGLGVDGMGKVGEPQTIGKLKGKTGAGDVYVTNGGERNGDNYWLMHGNQTKARFIVGASAGEGGGYTLLFDNNRGIPSGSMPTFVKEVENMIGTDIHIVTIQLMDRTIMVSDMTWEPTSEDEFIMEEDGVKFYSRYGNDEQGSAWYNAIDGHGQHIFNMSIDDKRLHVRMVKDVTVAGYYAVYLIEHLEADIGEYGDYSSFARELLDETKWFEGGRSNTWYVMDENFPIHFTETHSYDDDTEEDVTDEDTTMVAYWNETGLYDSGLESDYFAGEYEQVYRGGNTGYDDEREDDEAFGGRTLVRTDYYINGIGDENTVTHPISGGSVRISR